MLKSLQLKLLFLVALSLGIPLAVAILSLVRVYGATQELDRISRMDFHAQQTVSRATIRFKQQVQEWKDVLLRGQDPAALDKYWTNFTRKEKEAADTVREARDAIAYEDLREKLDRFAAAHRAAGERYRAGLEAFKASGFDPKAGDKAVAGVDRPPTELLLAAELTARERGEAAVSRAVEGARTAYLAALASVIVVVCIALLLLWRYIRRGIVDPVREAAGFAARISQGDLTGSIKARSGDEIGQLATALERMNTQLLHIVQRVRDSAQSVATASSQVAGGTAALSQQTEEQASSLEETAASMEELSGTVTQNAESARRADALARQASATAGEGRDAIREVVATMGQIDADAGRIAEFVTVINSIAFQTNILALNAAVEAARAGEQGRGFAVVAAEVRSLAQRSADAAKEIKSLIDLSAGKVRTGTLVVEQAGATIGKLVSGVGEVSGLMAAIAQASNEQARGVQQINRTVTEMDKVVQQNASAVQESASAAEAMRQQAEELVRAVSVFTVAASAPAQFRDASSARQALQARAPRPATAAPRAVAAVAEEWREF